MFTVRGSTDRNKEEKRGKPSQQEITRWRDEKNGGCPVHLLQQPSNPLANKRSAGYYYRATIAYPLVLD